jgi:septal ring factor EnvC (AmiA/AmiB activator)
MSVKNRLSRLEKATAETRAKRAAYEARAAEDHAEREAAWAIMQQTMSEEHVRLVVEAYAAGPQYVQSSEYNTPAGRLLRRCLDAISRLTYRWPQTEIGC